MTLEPHEGIDPYNNSEADQPSSKKGSPIPPAPKSTGPAPEMPERFDDGATDTPTGTAAGDPTAGVGIDEAEAEEAVEADTGPAHDGARGAGPGAGELNT